MGSADLRGVLDDARNQAIFLGFLGGHPEIPITVRLDLLHGLARLLSQHPIEALAKLENLFRGNPDVRGLPSGPSTWLMQQEAGVGKTEARVLLRREQDRNTDAGDPARSDGHDRRLYKSEEIVDRIAGVHMSPLTRHDHTNRIMAQTVENHSLTHHSLSEFFIHLPRNHDGSSLQHLGCEVRLRLSGRFFRVLHRKIVRHKE